MARHATFPVDAGWRPLLKDLGIRADRVLRRAGLPEELFARPHPGLTTAEYFRLWESLEAEADDPLLPLRLVETIRAESFIPPIFAALCSANMVQAAQRLATYKRLIAPMSLDVGVGRDGALSLSPHWLDAQVQVPFVVMATELAFLLQLARLATREAVAAVRVTLPQLPARAQAGAYATFFGVAVQRGDAASLALSAADANRPFLTANDAMWQAFEPNLRQRLGELDATASTAQRVRSALLELLPGGESGIDAVAGRLSMSRRTLQRRLGQEGGNYRALVNGVREDLARHYLTKTALSAGEIGYLLGFEDANSFFRAFNDWTGTTPDAVRRTAQ
ncbi:MAG TPA: AraC family transcriptional regulator ligand-binding domain-containing protein [Tahibacter sp.]|nr:AraC family transcriptional regulator ligand-binding domain-containing protein [Tahibacter sp.]